MNSKAEAHKDAASNYVWGRSVRVMGKRHTIGVELGWYIELLQKETAHPSALLCMVS